jgi:hypothetical protein
MLQSLLGEDASLEPLKQRLIESTQGNPFFLEESVQTLVETQGAGRRPGSLSPDRGAAEHPGTGHGAGGAGGTH